MSIRLSVIEKWKKWKKNEKNSGPTHNNLPTLRSLLFPYILIHSDFQSKVVYIYAPSFPCFLWKRDGRPEQLIEEQINSCFVMTNIHCFLISRNIIHLWNTLFVAMESSRETESSKGRQNKRFSGEKGQFSKSSATHDSMTLSPEQGPSKDFRAGPTETPEKDSEAASSPQNSLSQETSPATPRPRRFYPTLTAEQDAKGMFKEFYRTFFVAPSTLARQKN